MFKTEQDKAKFRKGVEDAPELGRGKFFEDNGKPCCALGHGLAALGYASNNGDDPWDAMERLGLTPTEYDSVYHANDSSRRANRKAAALRAIDAIEVREQ